MGTMRAMKALIGLLWGLGGMVLGFIAGALAAALFAYLNNTPSREGAVGYLVMAIGFIGALIGLGVGLWLYARGAPVGQGLPQLGQGVFGVLGFVAVVALLVWGWVQSREVPLMYDGNRQASLLLEFRVPTARAPQGMAREWLNVEVTTSTTRPEALVLQDRVRTEGGHLVVPAVQGPLYRSGNRLIVARLGQRGDARRDELFSPRMPRTPDPKADWSEWVSPQQVMGPTGEPSKEPALLQMRWRLELYGQ